jgi:hypothetical protein
VSALRHSASRMLAIDRSFRVSGTPTWLIAILGAGSAVVVGVLAAYKPLAGLAVIVVVALALALIDRPAALASLVAGVVPVISGFNRGLLIPGFRVSEVAIIGAAVLVLIRVPRGRALRWGAFDWLALLYAAATAVLGGYDTLHRSGSITGSALGTMIGPLQYLALYRVIGTALQRSEDHRRGLRLFIAFSPVVSLSAIAQQINVPGVRNVLATLTGSSLYGPNPQEGGVRLTIAPRASGVFPFWHETGGYLMIVSLLIISLLLSPKQQTLSRKLLSVLLIVDLAALVETVTIAPILGTIVGAIALGIWYNRGRVVVEYLVAAAVILTLIFLPLLAARSVAQFSAPPGSVPHSALVPETIAYRLVIFKDQDLPLLRGNWLTGYGPSLPNNYTFDFTESLYFTLLIRGGIILLAIYIGLITSLALRAVDVTRHAETVEQLLVARVLLVTIALLVFISFIEGYFVDTGTADAIWVLAGLTAAAGHGRGKGLRRPFRRQSPVNMTQEVTAPG